MTSILDYNELREDIMFFLKPAFDFFNLEENNKIFDPKKHHLNTHMFCSNQHIVVELNSIIHFPYSNAIDVNFHFINELTVEKVTKTQINKFLGINLNYNLIPISTEITVREQYQLSIQRINLELLFIYTNLLNGIYNYEMYKTWMQKIERFKKIEKKIIPSYIEFEMMQLHNTKS